MTEDRLMSLDIAQARGTFDDGSLLRAVGEAIARPLGAGVQPGAGMRWR
jgi:hypothetical protein